MRLADGKQDPEAAPALPDGDRVRFRGRVAVVINEQSGPGDLSPEAVDGVLRGIERGGGEPVELRRRGDVGRQLDACRDDPVDAIVAIGGDGTIAGSAAAAISCGASLLPLPAGSMNLFVQDLGLPPAIEPIVAHLDDLACLGVDYASVNGLVFLHSSLIGVGPRLGRLREEFREAGLWERAVLLPRMIGEAFGSEAIGVDIESDAGTTSVRTRSVAVANNPLSGETISHRRLTVAAGSLAVYASAHKGAFASLRLLASLGTGRLPRDPETLSARCREVTIGSGRDELLVSNDGEVSEMRAPLAYRVHPRGLRVLVPTAFIGGRVR